MSLFRGLGFRKDATRGTTPIEVRKSLAGLFSATGVMPGGPSPLLTGNADWTYTVHGPAWFVATRGPSDGVALYGNDGDTIIGTTGVGSTVPIAPGAGLSRIDIAWTRHQSAGENGDPATTVALASEPLFGVASGTAASSSPVAPVIPAGAIELGRNTMTSAATSCSSTGNTITQSAPIAVLRGVLDPAVVNKTTAAVGPTSGTARQAVVVAPNVTGDGVKKFKITASVPMVQGTVVTDHFYLVLLDATTGVDFANYLVPFTTTTAGIFSPGGTYTVYDTPAAGLHGYRLDIMRAFGTGTGLVYLPAEIIVEQIA